MNYNHTTYIYIYIQYIYIYIYTHTYGHPPPFTVFPFLFVTKEDIPEASICFQAEKSRKLTIRKATCCVGTNLLSLVFVGQKPGILSSQDRNYQVVPPKFNIASKNNGWKTTFLLGRPISRGYVKFPGCKRKQFDTAPPQST